MNNQPFTVSSEVQTTRSAWQHLGLKRLADIGFAVSGILILAPCWLIAAGFLASRAPHRVLQRQPRLGRHGKSFTLWSFKNDRGLFLASPVLWNILAGDMSLIGPRAAAPGEMPPEDHRFAPRYAVRPGLLCLFWLRKQSHIAYEPEAVVDAEYAERCSFRLDAGILLRAVPVLLEQLVFGKEDVDLPPPEHLDILGIPITNASMQEAVDLVLHYTEGSESKQICFVYADCANIACRNPQYAKALRDADAVFADGMGMKIAAKLLGGRMKENLCGTDVFPRLCQALADRQKSVYLLGAKPGHAEGVAAWIAEHHPSLVVRGHHHGFFSPEETESIVSIIAESNADVLLVAMGVPIQDLWVHQWLHKTNVKVAIGVGALFDLYSGSITRAPLWVREMNLEWVFRLCQEPGRLWRRYLLGNIAFLARVFRQRLRDGNIPRE